MLGERLSGLNVWWAFTVKKLSKDKQGFIGRVTNTLYLATAAKERIFVIVTKTWGVFFAV